MQCFALRWLRVAAIALIAHASAVILSSSVRKTIAKCMPMNQA